MSAKQAYKEWKDQFKVNMMVYTDEQMFEIGYSARDAYVKELEDLVKELAKTALKKENKFSKKIKCKLCKTVVEADENKGLMWCACGSVGIDSLGDGMFRTMGEEKNFTEVKNGKAKG